MTREVTLRGLNKAYAKALFSSKAFWTGLILYAIGTAGLMFNRILGGAIMVIAGLIMINADWNGRKRVVNNLQWKK
ncbi:MAG: hypothetical protein WCK90_03705 [archaeon]